VGLLTPARRDPTCPRCKGLVKRVPRIAGDRRLTGAGAVRRYRCVGAQCLWEGIIAAQPVTPARGIGRDWRVAARRIVPVAILLVAVAYGFTAKDPKLAERQAWEAIAIAASERPAGSMPPLAMGESFDGAPLAHDDARKPAKPAQLVLRRACAWGVPGRDPYKGTVAQALGAAKLPEPLVRKFGALIEMKLVSAQVQITREGITSLKTGRPIEYKSMDMAFGNTMCFNTRVNFKPGHVELADLYQTVDEDGKVHTVMVPYACGNVTVLGDRDDRDNRTDGDVLGDRFERAPGATGNANNGVAGRNAQAARKDINSSAGSAGTGTGITSVPEPATLALFAGGVVGLAWLANRRRRHERGTTGR
jgi:hypothetical protein